MAKEVGYRHLSEGLSTDVKHLAEFFSAAARFLHTSVGDYIVDGDGKTILLFQKKVEGGYTAIYSPLSEGELSYQLLLIPEESRLQLMQALHLPQPDHRAAQAAAEQARKIQEDENMLHRALKLPSAFHRPSGIPPPAQRLMRGIVQKEYAVTCATSEKPVIGTFGLGPCIACTGWHPQKKIGALAHMDAGTCIDSLDALLREFGSLRHEEIEWRLVGGDQSRTLAIGILRWLETRRLTLFSTDILTKPHPSAFVLDTKTGKLMANITPVDNGAHLDLRMQCAGLKMNSPLCKEFDGR